MCQLNKAKDVCEYFIFIINNIAFFRPFFHTNFRPMKFSKQTKIIVSVLFLTAILEIGIGAYFLSGYFQARDLSLIKLGSAWEGLVAYWLAFGVRSLSFGLITFLSALLILKRKKVGYFLAVVSAFLVYLLFLFLSAIV